MFIDEVNFEVKGGRGGSGAVTYFPGHKSGPSGGCGGNGGNVLVTGDPNLADLHHLQGKILFEAEGGTKGANFNMDGKNGDDLVMRVPYSTLLTNLTTRQQVEILDNKTVYILAQGGIGGKGNFSFKSATVQLPKFAEPGTKGEKYRYSVVVRLIADLGLIGLPNAGKSSLINELTKAHAKIGIYPFTTLEPNLGVFHRQVIADIPGLIEGASTGKGLGIKFLKHVEKTKVLLHCLSLESKDILKEYKTVRQEIGNYNGELLKKRSVILLTKTDLVTEQELKQVLKLMKKESKEIFPVSIYNPEQFDTLQKFLLTIK